MVAVSAVLCRGAAGAPDRRRTGADAERRPLTAIRGFAALWVVGHHWQPLFTRIGLFAPGMGAAWKLFAPGFLAVDFFFALSGFILAAVYARFDPRQMPGFLLKRCCRIYPLNLAILAAMAVEQLIRLACGAPLAGRPFAALPSIALLVQPFTGDAMVWNAPAWSLGVELVCYLIFPLMLLPLRRAPAVLVWTTAALLLCAEYRLLPFFADTQVGGRAVLRGLTGFGLGMALWRGSELVRLGPVAAGGISLAVLIGIARALATMHWGWIGCLGPLLIFALAYDAGPLASLLRRGVCVWLGRVSFSIYLLHLPLIMLLRSLLPPMALPLPRAVAPYAWALLLLALLLGLSELTYRYIEVPGRRLPARLARRLRKPLLPPHTTELPV